MPISINTTYKNSRDQSNSANDKRKGIKTEQDRYQGGTQDVRRAN